MESSESGPEGRASWKRSRPTKENLFSILRTLTSGVESDVVFKGDEGDGNQLPKGLDSHNEMPKVSVDSLMQLSGDADRSQLHQAAEASSSSSSTSTPCLFEQSSISNFKHVMYNLLAQAHLDPNGIHLVEPITLTINGRDRKGFRFNGLLEPEKRLAELYAFHIHKRALDQEQMADVFIQDLYRFYARSCVELLSKYFQKLDRFTYIYEEEPLFQPGETLIEAKERLSRLQTRSRKPRKFM